MIKTLIISRTNDSKKSSMKISKNLSTIKEDSYHASLESSRCIA